MKLRAVEGVKGLFEIVDDKERSVFDLDAAKFRMSREMKRQLKNILIQVCQALEFKGLAGLEEFIADDLLKKIERNARAEAHNLWEVRSPAHGGRLFFVLDGDGSVIVSAVDKSGKERGVQEKAINRGINRWEKLLKD